MKSINIQISLCKAYLLFIVLVFVSNIGNGQTTIFTSTGLYTYNNTDTITEDIFGPVDVSNCNSIQVNVDYNFSSPWEGSGNMESQDECGNCNGDPLNQNSDCLNPPIGCWDFLFVRIILDGAIIDTELIGDSGTTDLEQSGTISLSSCISNETTLEIEIYTQTWASNEAVTFSNIEVLCWDDEPLADASPNPVCENANVQLQELNGNFISWSWSGPSSFSSSIQNPVISSFNSSNEGIYTVTVEDANGCFLTDDVEVFFIPAPMVNTGFSLESCGPAPVTFDLSFLESQLNSDPTLTFEWYEDINGFVTIPNPSSYSSSGGVVYVSVLDPSSGCYSDTVNVDLTVYPQPFFSVPSDVTVCEGLQVVLDTLINPSNTSLTYTYHDGVPPSAANEIIGATTFNNNTVISVVGTDANNCSDTQYVNLQTVEVPLAPPASSTSPYCEGEDIVLQADPPVLPFLTYVWSGPNGYMATGPNQTITNASVNEAGTYQLIATLAGCSSQPTPVEVIINPLPAAPTVTDPLSVCFGDALQLFASSDPGSQYSWTGPNGFVSSNQNPTVTSYADFTFEGVYTVIPSLNGCMGPGSDVSVSVLDSPEIILQVDQDILCSGGNSGAISVIVSNAPPPFVYDWDNDIYDGMNFISGLSTGTYTLTVTDGNGCSSTASLFLQEPDPINLFCEQEQPVSSGGASDGAGDVFIMGGTEPYELSYDNGAGNSGILSGLSSGNTLISNLEEGTYQVTITDANGCVQTCQFTITTNACSINLTTTLLDSIQCYGDSTATLQVNATMGSGNYIYTWEDVNGNTISDSTKAVDLPAGTYYASVQDANDTACTAFATIEILQPELLQVLSCNELQSASMPGAADGQALISWSGGNSPFTIISSGPVTDTFMTSSDTLLLDSLLEGAYVISLIDDNGCMDSCSFQIQGSSCDLDIELDTAYFTACPSDSSLHISLTVMNQTPSTVFVWNGDTLDQSSLYNLPDGIYEIIALDTTTLCSDMISLDLTYSNLPSLICSVLQNPSSPGAMDGEAQVVFPSIQNPYELYLRGPMFPVIIPDLRQDTFNIFDLDTGAYTVIVTDSLGCVDSCTFNLFVDSCTLNISLDTAYFDSCPEDSSLIIELSENNPSPNIIYLFGADTFSSGSFSNLPSGSYTFYAVDTASACRDSITVTQNYSSSRSFTCTVFSIPSAIGSRDGRGGIIIDSISKPYSVNIIGYNYSNTRTDLTNDTIRFNNLDSGLYLVTITDSLGCSDTCSFFMPDGGCDIFSIDSIITLQPSCANDFNGEIEVFVSGGSGNYNFDWNVDSLDGNSRITNLGPGTYGITVTDNNLGCRVQGQRTIFPAEDIEVSLSFSSSFCEGDSVEVSLNIQNGTPPYTAQLDNGSPFTFSSDTSIWTFNENPVLEISDNSGCSQTDTLNISLLDPLMANLDTVLCTGGEISVGNEIFDENRPTGQVIFQGGAGNGCDSIVNVNLEFQDPELEYEILVPSCITNQNSQIRITSWSASGDFTLFVGGQIIQNPQLPLIIDNLSAGTYDVFGESSLQCRTEMQQVRIEAPMQLEVDIDDISSIEAGDSVLLEGFTTSGFSTANWAPSNTVLCDSCLTTLAYPNNTTTYVLTIQDSLGCTGVAEITVIVSDNNIAWYVPNAFSPNGDGINDFFTLYGEMENGQIDQLLIFDRWGNLLFENRDIAIGLENTGWDGTSKGQELDPGVYIYSIDVTTSSGEKLYFKGSVTLLK